MTSGFIIRFIAFVVFAAAVSGGVYGAYETLQSDDFALRGLAMEVAEPELMTVPGGMVGVGVAVTNPGEVAETVRVTTSSASGIAPQEAVTLEVPARNGTGGFLVFPIPEDATPGDVTITIVAETAREPVKRAQATFTLTILDGTGATVSEGDAAVVRFVGHLEDGTVFHTNIASYASLPFPKSPGLSVARGNATLSTTDSRAPDGLREGLVGMHEGEARALVIPAEKGYGPAEFMVTTPRHEEIERRIVQPVQAETLPFAQFDELIASSGKTSEDVEAGETVTISQQGRESHLRVTAKGSGTVSYVPAPQPGERVTVPDHPYWPQGGVVESSNDTAVVLRLEPTNRPGEAFTFREEWPQATTVAEVREDVIVLEHSPAVGLEYERKDPRYQQELHHRIVELGEDEITVAIENPSILGGKTIVYEIRVLSVVPANG